MNRKHLISAVGLTAAAALTLTAAPASAATGDHDQLKKAYDATVKYRSEEKAIADGYVRSDECAESPDGAGGMGYHYVKEAHIGSVDPAKPAALLYKEDKHGKRHLTGVEYLVPDKDQDLTTDEDRPFIFGVPMEGPMEGHEPGMPIHYDLHVWLFKDNPSGLFATWNPNVHCPKA
ncbi:hypothetical protein [Streptomyces sp. NPDC047928]|uniref:hypothetical protein n=1 Tax=unclassified Streptomyces TaxID=2593676 RepID=UPI0037199553